MLEAKNLIGLKQLRQPQLSGYILAVTSGYVFSSESGVSGVLQLHIDTLSGYVNTLAAQLSGYTDSSVSSATGALYQQLYSQITGLSGQISTGGGGGGTSLLSFRAPITSGIDTVNISFGSSVSTPTIALAQIGTSGAGSPYLISNITALNATGATLGLSDTTNSSNYYLNLLIKV